MTRHHGVSVIEINEGARPIQTIATAIIGLVAISADADNDYFPLNDITLVTNIDEAIGKAGNDGTLKLALEAIAAQVNPIVIVSRVEEGASDADTKTNIIGDYVDGKYTGIKGFEAAKARFGFGPRILGAPGFESDEVTAQLVTTAQAVRGFAYAQAPVETKEAAIALRGNYGARELMLLWPDLTSSGNSLLTAAYAMGLRAKIDAEVGWHRSLSNYVINGVTGISHDVSWDLQNPSTDAGALVASEVTTIINEKGFRFWGGRTTSADPKFSFESYTRSAQVIRDSIAEAHFEVVGKGITKTSARDIVENVNRRMRDWVAQGYILGGSCWIRKDANGKNVIINGQLVIDYDFTPIPMLEDLQFRQRITDSYLVDLVNAIAA